MIGATKSGKTTSATIISESTASSEVVSMSEFFRRAFSDTSQFKDIDRSDISRFSQEILRRNININIQYVLEKLNHSTSRRFVFEGFRNPYEFMKFFDATQSLVVFLLPSEDMTHEFYTSDFERDGIFAIEQCISWLEKNTGFSNVLRIKYSSYNELNEELKKITKEGINV